MTTEEIKDILSQIHLDIQSALDLAKESLLKGEKEHEIVSETKNKLNALKPHFGEVEQLKIERAVPMWLNQPKSGIFIAEATARKALEPLLNITAELINTIGSQIPQKDIFITENSPFEGRKILRSILNQAKSKVFLIDAYLRPEILEVVQLNLIDNPNIKICFLTQKNNNKFFSTFSTDILALSAQYPNAKIELKHYDKLTAHDRYIVIDENTIYHSGHSFAELGNRASSISKVEGNACDTAKTHTTDLWLNGNK
jgi:hypothetical protein